MTIRKFATALLLAVALVPAMSAQTATFTGKWEGTFTVQRPDGATGDIDPLVFNLTQKGQELTGTVGDAEEQLKVEKGVVDDGTATFEIQQPNGPLMKFSLKVIKDKLEGEMQFTRNGVVRATARVEATKAK